MSMDARGQLGKMLVFMGWKGIKDVRSYVVPANPKSAGQVVQRGFMADAVDAWHQLGRNILDTAAFNLLASLEVLPMSGFNTFCKRYISNYILGYTPISVAGGVIVSNAGGSIVMTFPVGGIPAIKGRYGYSPLVMSTEFDAVVAAGVATYTMGSLTIGATLYFQPFIASPHDESICGIYRMVVAA